VPADAARAHTLTVRACRAGSLEACVAAGISPPRVHDGPPLTQ
jgi:hypothetical protein